MKKPQMEVAETLYEIGLPLDVIEVMTQISPRAFLTEYLDEQDSETNEKHK